MVTRPGCTCLFFSLWKLEFKVDPSSPESSIHNEWLLNLMYASVESCSACSRPCLRLAWDRNEAIFMTDFCTCRSSDTSSLLLMRRHWRVGPGEAGITWLTARPRPPPRQSHTRSIIKAHRGVCFHFNNSPQMTRLKAPGKRTPSIIYHQLSV